MIRTTFEMTEEGFNRLKDGLSSAMETDEKDIEKILEEEIKWKIKKGENNIIIDIGCEPISVYDERCYILVESLVNAIAGSDDDEEADELKESVRKFVTVLLNTMFMAGSKIIVETEKED